MSRATPTSGRRMSQLALDLWPAAATPPPAAIGEPAWRLQLYGPPLAAHDPRCWLDPRHHAKTPCSWPAAKDRL